MLEREWCLSGLASMSLTEGRSGRMLSLAPAKQLEQPMLPTLTHATEEPVFGFGSSRSWDRHGKQSAIEQRVRHKGKKYAAIFTSLKLQALVTLGNSRQLCYVHYKSTSHIEEIHEIHKVYIFCDEKEESDALCTIRRKVPKT